MNAVTLPTRTPSPWRDAAAFAWHAWASTTRRQWAAVLGLGVVISLVALPHRLESIRLFGEHPLPVLADLALPLVSACVMYLGWVLAAEGSDRWRPRRTRLVYALFGAGAVATVTVVAFWHALGPAELWQQLAAAKGKPFKAGWLMLAAEYINMLVLGGMVYAVAEVFCQRSRTQRIFEAAVRSRTALEHQVLESRLAAMQAQVEPRFLFDTLVDIEALYERDPLTAAANLDRLISYLRAALPRLREAGSTVEAELELVRAYLDVVTSLHDGRPRLTIEVADDCRRGRFYPMLLLPLVQRAVRPPSGATPESIAIDVRRAGSEVVVAMRVSAVGGCADDPELARVRERLAGLYGAAATLACVEHGAEATELTLRIPANGAAAAQ
jgi:hypothetical protein